LFDPTCKSRDYYHDLDVELEDCQNSGQGTAIEDCQNPVYELYDDDVEGTKHEHVPDIDDVTPEDQDNYVGAEVN
jgi:hypothetical protein